VDHGPSLAFAVGAIALLASWPAAGLAQGPYKCRGAGAVPVYQDAPCPPGGELRNLADDPPSVSVVPFAPPPPPAAVPRSRAPKPDKVARKERARASGDAAERRHVHEGMSEGEVLARVGAPDLQAGRTGRLMRWTYLPATGDPQTVTVLRFEDGKVTHVERRILR
jgi:hypothetical protein